MKYAKTIINLIVGALVLWLMVHGLYVYIYIGGVKAAITYFLTWLPTILALLFIVNPNWLVEAYPERFTRAIPPFYIEKKEQKPARSSLVRAVLPQIFAVVMMAALIVILTDASDKPLVITIFIVAVSVFIVFRWLESRVSNLPPESTNRLDLLIQVLATAVSIVLLARFFSLIDSYWQQYSQFSGSGITAQATVLYRRYDAHADTSYVIYHFAALGQPENDYVARARGDLEVNSNVNVVYLPANPSISLLAANLQLPLWNIVGLILFSVVTIILLLNGGLGLLTGIGIGPPRTSRFAQSLNLTASFLSAVLLATVIALLTLRFAVVDDTGNLLIWLVIGLVLFVLVQALLLKPTQVTARHTTLIVRSLLGTGFNIAGTVLGAFWHSLLGLVITVLAVPTGWLKSASALVGKAFSALGHVLLGLVNIVRTVIGVPLGWIATGFRSVMHLLSALWHGLLHVVSILIAVPLGWLKSGFALLANGVSALSHGLANVIRAVIGVPLGLIAAGFRSVMQLLSALWHGLLHVVVVAISSIPMTRLKSGFAFLANGVSTLWHGLMNMVRALIGGLSHGFALIADLLRALWHGLLLVIGTLAAFPLAWLKSGFALLANGVSTLWHGLMNTVRVLISGLSHGFALVAEVLRVLWHGLLLVIGTLVMLPLRWLHKGFVRIGNVLGAMMNFFLIGLFAIFRVVIGVPLGWIGKGFERIMHILGALWNGLIGIIAAGLSVPLRWIRKAFVPLSSFLVLLISAYLMSLGVSSAAVSWSQYNQYTASGEAFVISKRQDMNSGKSYVSYRFSVNGRPESNYVAEDEGNQAVDSKVDIVYMNADPSISELAANHQIPLFQTALPVLVGALCVMIVLRFMLPLAQWAGIRPRSIP